MPVFKLTVAYDGTGFVGWQRQRTGTSVQQLLEDAVSALDGRRAIVTGAGRTDAGVHALAQVASVSIERPMEATAIVRGLNARLPPAVRVLAAARAADAFHARFAARAKAYRYRIWNAEVMSPFERRYAWHVASPRLDVDAMAAAAGCLVGRHDFAAFQAAGSSARSTQRVVFESRVSRAEGGACGTALAADGPERPLVLYHVSGDGFLRHMVRTIVGTLVEIGRGRRPIEWMGEVLESRDRSRAGPTAPAAGLFLVGVQYDAAAVGACG